MINMSTYTKRTFAAVEALSKHSDSYRRSHAGTETSVHLSVGEVLVKHGDDSPAALAVVFEIDDPTAFEEENKDKNEPLMVDMYGQLYVPYAVRVSTTKAALVYIDVRRNTLAHRSYAIGGLLVVLSLGNL